MNCSLELLNLGVGGGGGARLELHVGWSGWTRPPTIEGGRQVGEVEGFFKGSKRPEAG